MPPLVVELVPIDSVRPDPDNAREHNERSIDALVADLKQFGQQKNIVVDRDGVIKAGNGTWRAAKLLKWSHINIARSALDSKRVDLYAVADNRTAELSYFDDAALAEKLQGVSPDDLLALGFDQPEAEALLAGLEDPLEQIVEKAEKGQGHHLDVMVRLMISVKSCALVEDALTATGEMNRETALLAICKAYLDGTRQ